MFARKNKVEEQYWNELKKMAKANGGNWKKAEAKMEKKIAQIFGTEFTRDIIKRLLKLLRGLMESSKENN